MEEIVDIPPEEQVFSHLGSKEYFDWPPETLLGDIQELNRLTKDSHIWVIKREDLATNSFEPTLQDFAKQDI